MAGKSNGNKGNTGGKSGASGNRSSQNQPKKQDQRQKGGKAEVEQSDIGAQIVSTVCGVLGALIFLILILTRMKDGASGVITGPVGYYICALLYGLLGIGAWLVPIALIYMAFIAKRAIATDTITAKVIATAVFICSMSSVFYLFFSVTRPEMPHFYDFKQAWELSIQTAVRPAVNRGGVIGAAIGGIFYLLLKKIAWIFILLIAAGAMLVLTEVTPSRIARAVVSLIRRIKDALRSRAEMRRERAKELDREDERRLKEAREIGKRARQQAKSDNDDNADDGDGESERPRRRIKIFPDDGKLPEKSVSIKPLEYESIEESGSASDPELGQTLPPKLEEAAIAAEKARAAKEPPEPYDPNPYAGGDDTDPETDGGPDRELIDILFDENGVPRDGSGVIGGDDKEVKADKSVKVEVEGIQVDSSTGEVVPSTDDQFEKIADLQESDENDHALTDPDLADPDDQTPRHEYKFPPLTLLHKDQGGLNADHSEELKANGVKLVSALESFKVKTKITSISRGPTITRYELLPDQGVRVRAIANLVDDIALNLETSGVRIEAPIPGKAAVGIEVPNRTRETVYLRDLLEDPKFGQAGSRVTAALGMDVAGAPIFVDIAKMPHLLIAGTTGSGKSVCINSLITSLLFRATPDEVKLILIDPKKVELGVYNKLPHLLVPVVTNPKKAAGSLTWAVAEMEKRYEMIEEAGVRDVKGYNKLVDETGVGEKMPSIVIVIDELADLMMSAPDTVEDSICRIAQKARAAGMHLIIGTQRPSVDVITGLIKANIPSRIAFTVRSNVDSRTIIDIAGAEKLIGQGDMLYAPVGAMKPIRVQGAFVSDREVEAVCEYIKDSYGEVEYDKRAIDEIREHEAECEEFGKKKGAFGGAEDDGEVDPKFMECVHVAVESGKISTSLLQRRMGLGYGRAAKIIDRMTDMGIVSAPDGQKPRNVLISMSDYQEMVMRKEDD